MGRAPTPYSVNVHNSTVDIRKGLVVYFLHTFILFKVQQVTGLSLLQSHMIPRVEAHGCDGRKDWYCTRLDYGVHARLYGAHNFHSSGDWGARAEHLLVLDPLVKVYHLVDGVRQPSDQVNQNWPVMVLRRTTVYEPDGFCSEFCDIRPW